MNDAGASVVSVLIADDEALLRSGLRMILEQDEGIHVVAEAGDGDEAVLLAQEHRPDVVLMDIRMPGVDGIAATRQIIDDGSTTRVMMLTTYDLDEYLFRAIQAGASGFLLKTTPPAQLSAAIRGIVAGETLLAPEITRRLLERHVRLPPPVDAASVPPLDDLTERELDVLRLIAQGLSNTEIGEQLFLSTTTVKTHINRVFRKLTLRDRVHAVVLAYETGLVSPTRPPSPE